MMRWASIPLAAVVTVTACSSDGDAADAERVREARVGEVVEVDDDVYIEVLEVSVEGYIGEGEDAVPALTAEVRSENRSDEDRKNPLAGGACPDPEQPDQPQQPDQLTRALDLGTTLAGAEYSTWDQDARLPAGATDTGRIVFLLPNQGHITDPLPDSGCDQPVLRFGPSPSGSDDPPTVDIPLGEDVLAEYRDRQALYSNRG